MLKTACSEAPGLVKCHAHDNCNQMNKLQRFVLLGRGMELVMMDGEEGSSFSSLLPLTVNVPMTTFICSSIFWDPFRQELSWDRELPTLSDRTSQHQVPSASLYVSLPFYLSSHQGATESQRAKLIQEQTALPFRSNTETVAPGTMPLSPGLMPPFHNC